MFRRVTVLLILLTVTIFTSVPAQAWHGHHARYYGYVAVPPMYAPIWYPRWTSSFVPVVSLYRPVVSYTVVPRHHHCCWLSRLHCCHRFAPVTHLSSVVVNYPIYTTAAPLSCDPTETWYNRPEPAWQYQPSGGAIEYEVSKPVEAVNITDNSLQRTSLVRMVSDTSGLQLVAPASAIADDASLLQVDQLLADKAYAEAAQAYARLWLQFPNDSRLMTRRFVAQVAAGDFEQAAVIVDSARLSAIAISTGDLPMADLRVALGANTAWINQRTETLAANALLQPADSTPLRTVATWIELAGDSNRASLFHSRANQLDLQASGAVELMEVPVAH